MHFFTTNNITDNVLHFFEEVQQVKVHKYALFYIFAVVYLSIFNVMNKALYNIILTRPTEWQVACRAKTMQSKNCRVSSI